MPEFYDLPGIIWRTGLSANKPAFPLSKQYGYHETDTGLTWIASNDLNWIRVGSSANYWARSVRAVGRLNTNTVTAPASIDGITLAAGDRVLLTAQSSGAQNGIWVFNGAGNALTRPDDYPDGSTTAAFTDLMVQSYGTFGGSGTYRGALWRLSTTGTITIGTTSTAWELQSTPINDTLEIIAFPGAIAAIDTGLLSASRAYSLPDDSGVLGLVPKFAIIEDQKATNTVGGASVANAWTTRTFNTIVIDADGIVSNLSSNRFTLIPGTYRGVLNSPYVGSSTTVSSVRTRLRNVTTGAIIGISNNYFVLQIQGVNVIHSVQFTANGSDEFDLQYYITVARATNGLGVAVNEAGTVERYSQAFLEKL